MSMTCTECFCPAGDLGDTSEMAVSVIIALCENWRCTQCLDDLEYELANPQTNDPLREEPLPKPEGA